MKNWKGLNITIVSPSKWLGESAKSSSLLGGKNIHVIPHGLDIQRFKPVDKKFARAALMLPADKKLILFGANGATKDKNKGYRLFIESLKAFFQKSRDQVEIVVFGASAPEKRHNLGCPVTYVGHLWDDISMSLLYSACDVMVVPSMQESFGQTASESMACGCPVVAFNTSGLIDIVDHLKNGYLAVPFNPSDLANGINWVIEDDQRHKQLAGQARLKVCNVFELKDIAKRYLNLYEEILKR
jgi:glycosyltransferase involved in cell wall biosynthesis